MFSVCINSCVALCVQPCVEGDDCYPPPPHLSPTEGDQHYDHEHNAIQPSDVTHLASAVGAQYDDGAVDATAPMHNNITSSNHSNNSSSGVESTTSSTDNHHLSQHSDHANISALVVDGNKLIPLKPRLHKSPVRDRICATERRATSPRKVVNKKPGTKSRPNV